MDTESVRINKDIMKELRGYIIQNEIYGRTYGKISETIEKAVRKYLDEELKESLAEKLKNNMDNTNVDDNTNVNIIYDTLEFLLNNDCLNDKGKILRHTFLDKYIKNDVLSS